MSNELTEKEVNELCDDLIDGAWKEYIPKINTLRDMALRSIPAEPVSPSICSQHQRRDPSCRLCNPPRQPAGELSGERVIHIAHAGVTHSLTAEEWHDAIRAALAASGDKHE